MTPPRRRFMRPWKVIEHDGSYEIQDATGLPLASVYFENETIRQSSKDEARRLAAQIARLPTGRRPAGRRWTEAEERQLGEMLDAGMKVPNIARKLNRTAQAIYARLQRIYRKRRVATSARDAAP
jgi:DNA-binding NarL/FixJ family response regulator